MRWSAAACCLAGLFALAGAAPAAAQAGPEAVSLFTGQDCGEVADEAAAHWLNDEAAYQAELQKIMDVRPGSTAGLLPVDFSRQGVLCIAMGFKPTAGFSLGLASGEVTVDNKTATVRITWNEPPVGALVPQMLTSPCLLVRLPKLGFTAVRVVDQAGRQRMMQNLE